MFKRCHIKNVADHHRWVCGTDQSWIPSVSRNNIHYHYLYKQRKKWVNLLRNKGLEQNEGAENAMKDHKHWKQK